MGQKVHPYGFRVGVTKTWRSRWFAKQDYSKLLEEDLALKDDLRKRLKAAGVSSVEVDRPGNKLRITIRTSRPGIIIGRKGAEIEKLKQDLAKRTKREVFIDIQEVHKPDADAQLIAESIALQLEKRVAFRRAMRKSVENALRLKALGIKVRVSGRLNGAEIARSEWYLQGQLPLHTLRADIDYGFAEARTTYGVIGIKTWVYNGEILDGQIRRPGMRNEPERRQPRERRGPRPQQHQPQHQAQHQQQHHHQAPPPAITVPPVQTGVEQAAPSDKGAPPLVPPMANPAPPAWKQENKEGGEGESK